MSYALFEEAGKFHAGRVLSQAESSLQLELDSGKRVKVKAASVLLRFDSPAPAELIASATQLAAEIDLDLAWQFAPEDEFGFADLAREYFDASAGVAEQAAALLRLFEAPHYFRRLGRGRFRRAPEETVKAALAAIERKAQVAAQVDAWAAELAERRCPAPVREQLYRILFKPDKNAPEYKAVVEAARRTQQGALALLRDAGAIESPYQFHWQRFLFEQFAQGTAFPPLPVPAVTEALPVAAVEAFSIDDSLTTEIDDALSVQGIGSGRVTFGIHIAAPALAIAPDSPLDRVARERLSTVYLPGWKLTMLPPAVVDAYTLVEGRECPAVSLYVELDEATLEVRATETRVERVPIRTNLRHDLLDAVVTEDSLAGRAPADYPHAAELAFAFRLARALKQRREAVRGRPESFERPDYSFRLSSKCGSATLLEPPRGAGRTGPAQAAFGGGSRGEDEPPTGDEQVEIVARRRGAPLDLIVAEAMILANTTWGARLAELGVPGIYRSQASMLPGVKVRMGTRPLPHAGMGVAQYAWATSPLRRYVDLVNQWQLIACARHGRTAPLAAPFRPKDAMLFSIVSSYEATSAAYLDFQRQIERFWTLRWLEQQAVAELAATVLRGGLVRAQTLPLVFELPGTEGLPRGTHVRVRIAGIDLLTLELHAVLVARLDDEPAAARADELEDEAAEAAASGPLQLAIDVDEAGAPAAAT